MRGQLVSQHKKQGLSFQPRCKSMGMLWVVLVTVLIFVCASWAGLLWPSLPKGKEIDDPYLAQLFAPDFPYESIKIIETKEGKRYVIVKAKKTIDLEAQKQYRRPLQNVVMYPW